MMFSFLCLQAIVAAESTVVTMPVQNLRRLGGGCCGGGGHDHHDVGSIEMPSPDSSSSVVISDQIVPMVESDPLPKPDKKSNHPIRVSFEVG